MKYVVIDGALHDEIYIFMDSISHDTFIDMLGKGHNDVLGAGFIDFDDRRCYGKSVALDKRARPEDTILLRRIAY